MSTNAIRLLRKAIRLKLKSTIPVVSKWGMDTVRIWVPCDPNTSNSISIRNTLALQLKEYIKKSGVPCEPSEPTAGKPKQICYYIIKVNYIETLATYIRIC